MSARTTAGLRSLKRGSHMNANRPAASPRRYPLPELALEAAREARDLRRFVSKTTRRMIRDCGDGRSGSAVKLDLAILFSDMRGFTGWAEQMDPGEVFRALNRSLAVQMQAVRQHGGEIDKMLGDGLLARFQGPHRVQRALRAARAIAAGVRELPEQPPTPPVGLAVHEGAVLFGVLGLDWRSEHTVVGDVVNVAARLSGCAGPFQVVASTSAVQAVRGHREFQWKALGDFTLKGRSSPTGVFELVPGALPPEGKPRSPSP